jgi:GNAT superfamily N-acetyltransferase
VGGLALLEGRVVGPARAAARVLRPHARPAPPSGQERRQRLREIAEAAKGHWGYEQGRVAEWASSLDFARILAERDAYVAEAKDGVVAWASLSPPRGATCVLEDLWVDPRVMGAGVGSALFRAAVDRARELGARDVEWEAEPNAVGFYEKMGGTYVRDSEPSEWGRVLPVMSLSLGAGGP